MTRVYVSLAILAVALLSGWHYSSVVKDLESFKSRANKAEEALKALDEENNRVSDITDAHAKTVEKIVYVDKIVTKEVVKYRERVVNRCALSPEWVRIHNQAASGVQEDPGAIGANGASSRVAESGVDDADALEAAANNYHLYHVCKARLETLQDLIEPYVK